MTPEPPENRTRTGRVLTDSDIEALADEAERGYHAPLIEDVYAIRRTQIHDGLILKAIARQMGLTLPTAEEVDAELGRNA